MSTEKKESRLLTFSIFRYNPQIEGDEAHMQEFQLEETEGMTLFIALNKIREEQDSSLQFDFVCRAGICGSCSMVVNGKPVLACRTLTAKFSSTTFTLMPLPGFELIGDLSVNTGKAMRAMSEQVQSWIHTKEDKDFNLDVLERRMEPEVASQIYELERCIECGCCLSACATWRMRPDFLGAVGFMRLARFYIDPRDKRTDADYYEIIGDDDGVFGCMSLMGCEDHCPKDLPHQTQIAFLRRKMVKA